MRHEEALARLSALLDDELTEDEGSRLRAHLEGCVECREELERMRATVALLREAEPPRAPEGFAAEVRGRLDRLRSAPGLLERIGGLLRAPRWSWRTAAAAAAVALVVVFAANIVLQAPLFSVARRVEIPFPRIEGDRAEVDRGEGSGIGLKVRFLRPEATQTAVGKPGARDDARGDAAALPPLGDAASLRRVIKTGEIEIEVEVFDSAARSLLEIAERTGGFVASSSYSDPGDGPRGTLVLRVPASAFGEVLRQIEKLGKVQRRQVEGQDVTEQFVDLEARKRNLERHETRLLSLVERATKIADLMELEGEVARIRGEIERLTGRLRYLSDQVDLSTIQVEVTQKPKEQSGGFWDLDQALERVKAAFLKTVRQMITALEAVVALGAALLPLVLAGAAAWLLLRRIVGRRERAG